MVLRWQLKNGIEYLFCKSDDSQFNDKLKKALSIVIEFPICTIWSSKSLFKNLEKLYVTEEEKEEKEEKNCIRQLLIKLKKIPGEMQLKETMQTY